MKMKSIAAILASAITFGQDLKPVEPISVARLEAETLRDLREDQTTPAPSTPQTQPQPKKKSRKKLWITLAVVGAAAGVTVWAVNKRFGNEGKPIF
jgi:hypothetical protein